MNAYIESCIKAYVEVNKWFWRIVGQVVIEAFKEAVKVCRNE